MQGKGNAAAVFIQLVWRGEAEFNYHKLPQAEVSPSQHTPEHGAAGVESVFEPGRLQVNVGQNCRSLSGVPAAAL